MDGLSCKILEKWMIWGYHDFLKHPYKLGGGFLNIFLMFIPKPRGRKSPILTVRIVFMAWLKNHQRKHHSRAEKCRAQVLKDVPKTISKADDDDTLIHVSSLRIRGKSKPVKETQ